MYLVPHRVMVSGRPGEASGTLDPLADLLTENRASRRNDWSGDNEEAS